ncbi:MAG: hypothetical protein J6D37_00505 [Clostridia bacterium]|nr:hypothetical protein [Clostridia bacterium]
MGYIAWINRLDWRWRLVLALPVLDGIFYSIYRICQKTPKNVLLGIVWIPFGALIGWFPDMMNIASGKEIFML